MFSLYHKQPIISIYKSKAAFISQKAALYLHSLKPRAQLFERSFLNPRNVRARDTELFCNLFLRHRSANRAVNVRDTVPFADNFPLTLVKFLNYKAIKPLRVNFQLGDLLNVYVAGNYILDCERVSLGVAFDRLADVKLGLLVLHLAEVHFYLVSNNIVEETIKAGKKTSNLLKIFAYIALFFQYTV